MKFNKALINVFWLVFDKILKLFLSFAVTIAIARYLGPNDFGALTLAISIITIISTLSFLGTNQVLIKFLIKKPDKNIEYIISSITISIMVSSIFLIIFAIFTCYFSILNENVSLVLSILMVSLIFKSLGVVRVYFESKVESKKIVIYENSILLTSALFKVIIIYLGGGLLHISVIYLLEMILIPVTIFLLMKTRVNCNFKFGLGKCKVLIKEGWPLFISASAWLIYSRIDQLMLSSMIDERAVGIYSAATQFTDLMVIIPVIIATSYIPTFICYKENDTGLYNVLFKFIFNVTSSFSFCACVLVFSCSSFLITKLFGYEYIESIYVLKIHVWTCIFISIATVSGKYLLYEGLQKFTMYRHILGVLLNVPLNYFMIKSFGIVGAAYATLFSLFVSNLFFDLFFKEVRGLFIVKLESLILPISIFWLYKKRDLWIRRILKNY